jgi:hypothetical protein
MRHFSHRRGGLIAVITMGATRLGQVALPQIDPSGSRTSPTPRGFTDVELADVGLVHLNGQST